MFDRIKKWIKKEKVPIQKHVIVCIHGFGTRQMKEYNNFKFWNKNEFQLHTFDIYTLASGVDYCPEIWIQRCESTIESFLNAGYKVDVVGFSMGGVLATHVAAKYEVGRLFLISPAFDYMSVSNVLSKAKELFTKKENERAGRTTIPLRYTQAFTEVVKLCKDDISKVKCPVCFVHGDNDEVIPVRSSVHAFEKILHQNKNLFIIHNGTHRLMTQKSTEYETYQLFKLFMNHTIQPDEETTFVNDIYKNESTIKK